MKRDFAAPSYPKIFSFVILLLSLLTYTASIPMSQSDADSEAEVPLAWRHRVFNYEKVKVVSKPISASATSKGPQLSVTKDCIEGVDCSVDNQYIQYARISPTHWKLGTVVTFTFAVGPSLPRDNKVERVNLAAYHITSRPNSNVPKYTYKGLILGVYVVNTNTEYTVKFQPPDMWESGKYLMVLNWDMTTNSRTNNFRDYFAVQVGAVADATFNRGKALSVQNFNGGNVPPFFDFANLGQDVLREIIAKMTSISQVMGFCHLSSETLHLCKSFFEPKPIEITIPPTPVWSEDEDAETKSTDESTNQSPPQSPKSRIRTYMTPSFEDLKRLAVLETKAKELEIKYVSLQTLTDPHGTWTQEHSWTKLVESVEYSDYNFYDHYFWTHPNLLKFYLRNLHGRIGTAIGYMDVFFYSMDVLARLQSFYDEGTQISDDDTVEQIRTKMESYINAVDDALKWPNTPEFKGKLLEGLELHESKLGFALLYSSPMWAPPLIANKPLPASIQPHADFARGLLMLLDF